MDRHPRQWAGAPRWVRVRPWEFWVVRLTERVLTDVILGEGGGHTLKRRSGRPLLGVVLEAQGSAATWTVTEESLVLQGVRVCQCQQNAGGLPVTLTGPSPTGSP